MATTPRNCVVFIGSAPCCKPLMTRLAPDSAHPVDDKDHSFECLWIVDTKYYVAEVQLTWVPLEASSCTDTKDRLASLDPCAIVLVFQENMGKEWSSILRWQSILSNHPSANVLCVATGSDGTPFIGKREGESYNARKDEYISWCANVMAEFIEDCEPEDRTESSGPFVEKIGLSRLEEALQTSDWKVSVAKKVVPGAALRDIFPAVQSVEEVVDDGEDTNVDVKDEDTNDDDVNVDDEMKDGDDTNPSISQLVHLLGKLKSPSAPLENDDSSAIHSDAPHLEEDDLDAAFREIGRMRHVAGQMPDTQRREFAAKVALAFADVLGLEDDDEETH